MPSGGNNLSLIRKTALIALLALAGAGGEITPMFGATNPAVETWAECKINTSPSDLGYLLRVIWGFSSRVEQEEYFRSTSFSPGEFIYEENDANLEDIDLGHQTMLLEHVPIKMYGSKL